MQTDRHGADRTFFTQLEAFRGFAAILVAWFHSAIINGDKLLLIKPGNIYVDFFFVLSGFVLMHAYADRIGRGMSFYNFAVLRLARIWPLHMVMLGVFVLYGAVQWLAFAQLGIGDGPDERNTFIALVYNVLLIHSLGVMDGLTWNYPSWSISVEYFTYLLFFGLVLISFKARFVLSAIASVLGFVALFWIAQMLGKTSILASYDYGTIRCIAGFFAGTAIYGVYRHAPLRLGRMAMTVIEAACLSLSCWLIVQSTANGFYQFTAIVSFVVLIYVFASGRGVLSQIFSLPPFRFLGKISFSIYMVHAIFMSVGGFLAKRVFHLPVVEYLPGRTGIQTEYATLINLGILGIVIGVSWLTYHMIEKPGQRAMTRLLVRPDLPSLAGSRKRIA
jgi:peptidoglycan/LPS O-acetylase OafA/YrhL